MRHLDLFSGIGGFALAADWVWGQGGVEHIFCDNDLFCQEILKKHWPKAPIYGDIREITKAQFIADTNDRLKQEQQKCGASQGQGTPKSRSSTRIDTSIGIGRGRSAKRIRKLGASTSVVPRIDLLTGGFPCQPFSHAGRRRGTEDDRYLWPEMYRVIKQLKPTWVVGENVGGILGMAQHEGPADVESEADISDGEEGDFGTAGVIWGIINDLERAGYSVQTFLIPACALNAPHRRDRVWIVGHAEGSRGARALGKVPQGSHPNHHGSPLAQNTLGKRGGGRSKGGRQILERQSTEVQTTGPNSAGRPSAHSQSKQALSAESRGFHTEFGGADRVAPDTRSNKSRRLSGKRGKEATALGSSHQDVADTTKRGWGQGNSNSSRPQERTTTAHERDRLANRNSIGWAENWLEIATRLCRVDDGLSRRLDRNPRLKALGNAIVPQVAEEIFRAIKAVDDIYA